MVFSHHRDLECGGNAAALALFATDSSRGTSPRSYRSAESQSAAAGGALQMAFKVMHHLLVYKGVGVSPGLSWVAPSGLVSRQKPARVAPTGGWIFSQLSPDRRKPGNSCDEPCSDDGSRNALEMKSEGHEIT